VAAAVAVAADRLDRDLARSALLQLAASPRRRVRPLQVVELPALAQQAVAWQPPEVASPARWAASSPRWPSDRRHPALRQD
jgi:hypothetical protein